ncbi:MAG: DUF6452 family protein [Phocaeicola sp.]
MKNFSFFILLIGVINLLIVGCNESDCPLFKTSHAHFSFLDSQTHNPVKLKDSVVVIGFIIRGDTVASDTVFNRPETSMSLPLSYTTKTTYVMHYDKVLKDTIEVYHEPIPFVSNIDCKPMVFYHVERINYTRNALDSIVTVNPDINNEEKNNFQIYYTVTGQ